MYGLVLEPGEVAYVNTPMQYARLYGGSGRYTHSGGLFIGKPGLVLGMMAANAAVNASRKAAAKRDMQLMWRDLQEVPTVATNYRLLCHLPRSGWMSFYYSAVQEFYPDPANWMITFGFQNAEPLRLAGLADADTVRTDLLVCARKRPLARRTGDRAADRGRDRTAAAARCGPGRNRSRRAAATR